MVTYLFYTLYRAATEVVKETVVKERSGTPPAAVEIEVTKDMFDDLKNMVIHNQEEVDRDMGLQRDKTRAVEARITDAEA